MSDILRESNIIELKRELNDKLEKEVVAFLNHREGGDIYIGVDDDGNAIELGNIDAIQCAVADRIKNGLPMGLSEDDFFGCRSMPRNRELMRVFKDLDFVEQLGSGMTRILSAYDRSVFSFTSHFMTVRFDYPEDATPQATPQAEKINEIIKFCREPRTKREIANKCGLKDLNHLTRRYLNPMLEQGYICPTIPDKPKSPNQQYVANLRREE